MNVLPTFHVWQDGQSKGPVTVRGLQDMLKKGTLSRSSLIAPTGGDEWLPLSTYSDLIDPPRSAEARVSETLAQPPSKISSDAPVTAAVVSKWLLRAAFYFVIIGVVVAMVGAAAIGMPGFWFGVGPLVLALTTAIFAWSKP